jgi:hypothetical protein
VVFAGRPFAILHVEGAFRFVVAAVCAWVSFALYLEYVSVNQFSQIDCQPFSFYTNRRRGRGEFVSGVLGCWAHRDPGIDHLAGHLKEHGYTDSTHSVPPETESSSSSPASMKNSEDRGSINF